MTDTLVTALDVLDFWWQAGAPKWFARDDGFDQACRDKFGESIEAAKDGRLDHWANTADGALALILLLDQMSRNVHRDTAEAFAADGKALAIARHALDRQFDRAFPKDARAFFYLPFEHSEDMADQDRSVDLFRALGVTDYYHYALVHMDVIRRFGRFPHRNELLGRETTPEEQAYLADNGFSA
ncbi:DUF924 family protein [Roseibium aggregatum]|uniref:DUF924 domain-containing protein n=1 Tax=Roseibium aggregatum TaxID=187304 RepID=A0A939EIP1_9HYPH|nr:DUF924 family protein [Roseibium aggregatum]MBN9673401.1 DUF924 domain-containing protein [Roseibium aggregatum]